MTNIQHDMMAMMERSLLVCMTDLDNDLYVTDKFKGQGRHFEKRDFPTFSYGVTYVDCTEPFCHDT